MSKKKPALVKVQAFKRMATTYFSIRRLTDSIIGAGRLIRLLTDRNMQVLPSLFLMFRGG